MAGETYARRARDFLDALNAVQPFTPGYAARMHRAKIVFDAASRIRLGGAGDLDADIVSAFTLALCTREDVWRLIDEAAATCGKEKEVDDGD